MDEIWKMKENIDGLKTKKIVSIKCQNEVRPIVRDQDYVYIPYANDRYERFDKYIAIPLNEIKWYGINDK